MWMYIHREIKHTYVYSCNKASGQRMSKLQP